MLGFNPGNPHTDQAALDRVIVDYLAAHPVFHEQVAVPFASGDPVKVGAALRDFSMGFNRFVAQYGPPADAGGPVDAAPRGWYWTGANIAVVVNEAALTHGAVYANVAVATNALATLAVVTWYLEDGSPVGSDLERDTFVDALTSALA